MYFLTMDLGRIRVHLLLIILICWKHAVGYRSLSSQKVLPQQNWFVKESFGPQVVQSSVLEVPVTASIPSEEVVSVLAGNSPSSHYESMSFTQSAPSSSVSALILPQNRQISDSSVLASNSQYAFAGLDGSGLQGASSVLASTSMGSGSSTGLAFQSQGSSSPSTTGSFSKLNISPLGVSSQSSLDLQTQETFCQSRSSTGSSASSPRPVSPNGSSQSTSTQNTPVSSANAKLAIASPIGVISSTSGQGSNSQYTSSSQGWVNSQLAVSDQYVPVQGVSYSSVVQPQSATIQYVKPSSVSVPVYSKATLSGSPLSLSQSLMWQPSKSQRFQPSGTAASQGFLMSGATQSSSLTPSGFSGNNSPQSPGTTGLNAPTTEELLVYSQATPSGSWSPLQPSSSWSSGFQSSSTGSQSISSKGSKPPTSFSTLTSLGGLSQSTSTQYTPGSSAYVQLAASPLSISQSTSGQGSTSQYVSSSQDWVDNQLAASSQSVPVQGIAYSSFAQPQSTTSQNAPTSSAKVLVSSEAIQSVSPLSINQPSRPQPSVTAVSQGLKTSGTVQGSSLTPSGFSGSTYTQSQGTSGLYVPAALEEVLVYSQASPSGSWSPLQPSSSWSSGFQSSTTGSQSISSQGSKPPTSFSTLTSLGGLSQSTSTQYTPGSSANVQVALSPLSVSQSTIGQGSTSQSISTSQSWVDSQLASSSQYVPVQGIAYSSFVQPQSNSQNAPTSANVVVSKAIQSGSPLSLTQNWKPSMPQPSVTALSQGLQTSSTIQGSSLTPSGFSGSASIQSLGTSGINTPTAVKEVLVYSQAVPSGSWSLLQPSSSLSSTVSQSSTLFQGSKTPSSFSTPTSQSRTGTLLAGSSRYIPVQASTVTDGSLIQLQETSSQYVPTALDVELPLRQTQGQNQEFLISGPAVQWWPSSTSWSPDYKTSRTVVSQINSASPSSNFPSRLSGQFASPQRGVAYSGLPSTAVSQTSSSGSSQFSVLSSPVVQSTTSSSYRTPSLSSMLLRPSKPFQAASGSTITSPMSPAQSISVQRPIQYVASSVGSNSQAVSQGLVSVQSAVPIFDSSNFDPIDNQAMIID